MPQEIGGEPKFGSLEYGMQGNVHGLNFSAVYILMDWNVGWVEQVGPMSGIEAKAIAQSSPSVLSNIYILL